MSVLLIGNAVVVCMCCRFGRKAAAIAFHSVKMCGCVLSIYAPSYELFTLSRFFIAVGSTAANLATLLIGLSTSCDVQCAVCCDCHEIACRLHSSASLIACVCVIN